MTVAGGTVTYYVDGQVYFSSNGKYYPRDKMTIDFNEWFHRPAVHRPAHLGREGQLGVLQRRRPR